MRDVKPRIVIGAPCYGSVAPDVLEDWMAFAYACGRRMPQYDFSLAIKTKSEQFRARNAIVEAAQSVNADWLLMLDDDMIINPLRETLEPSADYGFLERLIAHDKDICGVLYYQRSGACSPVLMTKVGEKGYRFLRDDEITHGLQRVDVAGGGCLLIKMRVFDRLTYPYFEPEHTWGTDIQLCRQAQEKGCEVWADTAIEFGHVKNERVVITSRNRAAVQVTDSVPGEVTRRFISDDVYTRLLQDVCTWTGYHDLAEARVYAQAFLSHHATWKAAGKSDAEWYRQFPKERVARQLWFNTESTAKRQMTEFILNTVNHQTPKDILDFGCGIGIPAFTFAEKGHRVTACDIGGTGTLEFLKWRVKTHGLAMTFHESQGGCPHLGAARFDVIVAMDSLEHIEQWPMVLRELVAHLNPGGVLFANNAILDDLQHPEHYDTIRPQAFLEACAALGLRPLNQITYLKPVPVEAPHQESHAESAHSLA